MTASARGHNFSDWLVVPGEEERGKKARGTGEEQEMR
jgi:hypothetical protein